MRKVVFGIMLAVLASRPSMAEVKLVLRDGRELSGRSMTRDDSLYLLQQEGDHVLSIPVELVVKVLEERKAPTGIKTGEAQTLVGPPGGVKLSGREEQTAALLGSRSLFRRGVIDPVWVPTSDWDNDLRRNDFNPTRWFRSPIDPSWTPVSGLGQDATEFNPVHWYQPPIDSTWWPENGLFRRD